MASQVLCPVEAQYRPPTGYYDFPFIYVYEYFQGVNGGIADPRAGGNFYGQQVHVDGDAEFLLRKISRYALDSADTFQMYSPTKTGMFSQYLLGTTQSIFGIAPEREYPRNGSLSFDVLNWSSSSTLNFGGGDLVYFTQVLFQGVKRMAGTWVNPMPSGYPYREESFRYRQNLTLDWTYLASPYAGLNEAAPRQFSMRVEDYDFELLRISIVRRVTGAPVTYQIVQNINSPSFRMMLYDPERAQMFSAPVFAAALNQVFGGSGDRQAPSFPVPSIVYPKNSIIRFDIYSMLDDPGAVDPPTAQNFEIIFDGVRRMPL